ncbi:MAG: hypothetical protein JWQ84_3276 [Mucilaginibacter sp.]|nr:hypothetical protein [Mucilaginibacter sp.]MDB5018444.1 hypothetical protein [Mucilaginibacter sp.]MDB5141191.1 hypothetical protein [Mucilaginibacter sp.]
MATLIQLFRKRAKTYEMADLNKFIRSKERITELLNHLVRKNTKDENMHLHINDLQNSIRIIDDKMEEFKKVHRDIERVG